MLVRDIRDYRARKRELRELRARDEEKALVYHDQPRLVGGEKGVFIDEKNIDEGLETEEDGHQLR